MALKDALITEFQLPEHISSDIQEAVIDTLRDQALRREVFQFAMEDLDDISMVEIHAVLDALVNTLKGESLD